jgi:predicted  nucleic acid-binding Zn-ribbon protein
MDESTKRALDAALASPEFMAQVRQAVLESPIVKSKDAEIAHLQGEVEQAEREAQSERDDARNAARLCGEVEAERNALRTRVEELIQERDELKAALLGTAVNGLPHDPCWCREVHHPYCLNLRALARGGKGEG